MNRISKQKRNQLILVGVVCLIVVGGLWFTLIRYQQQTLQNLATQKTADESKLSQIRSTIKNSREIEDQLAAAGHQLALQQQDMASGDDYSWMVSFIRNFNQGFHVDMPLLNSGGVSAENLLPNFPFKQFTLSVSGQAYYSDLGRFIADFENRFPTSRLLNLDLAPASASGPAATEKLSFRMDIVTLVNPGGPANTP